MCQPGFEDLFGKPNGFTKQTGHFTQMVWKSTTKFGFAKVKREMTVDQCKKHFKDFTSDCTCWWGVAHYMRSGNVKGRFHKNVIKGTFDANKDCKADRSKYAKHMKFNRGY